MAQQPAHLPNYRERTVLQVLSSKEWEFESTFAKVAGPALIERMIQRAWVYRLTSDPNKIMITASGKDALQ